MKQVMNSQFDSMSFVTLLDYSVMNVGVVGYQPAVMMSSEMRAVSMRLVVHADVTPGLGLN